MEPSRTSHVESRHNALLETTTAGKCIVNAPEAPPASADCLSHLPDNLSLHRVLDTKEAAAFCRISVPHWRRMYRTGAAPAPIRLSSRKLGWPAGTLVNWLSSRNKREAA
jgi:predicted DNA-binding transcriptional regulator AlpA